MKKIKLYGALGKRFGKEHLLDVASIGEAIRALCILHKGFKDYLVSKKHIGYEVVDGKQSIPHTQNEYNRITSQAEDIKIIPRVVGASSGARIAVGVVLVALSFMLGPGGVVGAQSAFAMTAGQASMTMMMGASMILGGIIELLTKTSSGTTIGSDSEDSSSYIFSGPCNSTRQGNPVFVGYGEMIVGSQVVSATMTTKDI